MQRTFSLVDIVKTPESVQQCVQRDRVGLTEEDGEWGGGKENEKDDEGQEKAGPTENLKYL